MSVSHFWASRLHPDDRDNVLREFAALASGTFMAIEYRWRCADGTFHWFLDQAMLARGRKGREIIGTWLDISRRKRLESEVLEISEREQRRIGHDLHDDLSQQLASIEFLAQALEQRLAARAREDAGKAAEIARLVRSALNRTRELARGLSPVELEAGGLMTALEQLARSTRSTFRVPCRFRCEAEVLVRDNDLGTNFFRIAQEAVRNAIQHGRPTRIEIGLRQHGARVVLEVRDDGIGFPEGKPRPGMGLFTMQYRSNLIQGSLTIQGFPGKGTSVICSAPSAASQD